MSDSNWRQFIKDRGGLIASFAVASLFVVIVVQLARVGQWEIDYDAASNAASYAADAKNDIAAECRGLTAQARDDCEDKINDPARANQRDEYDLAAQQTMALWTAIMGGMAVVGVALSGVGVYLIWRTWGATNEAASNSRKTLDRYIYRERAILRCGHATYQCLDDTPLSEGFQVAIINHGPSPAELESVEWEYLDGPVWPERLRFEKFTSTVATTDNEPSTPHLEFEQLGNLPKWLAVLLNYRTLGSECFKTHHVFKIEHNPDTRYGGSPYFAVGLLRIHDQPFDT